MSRKLIRGERMKATIQTLQNMQTKQMIQPGERKRFPTLSLFITGFIVGAVLPNLACKLEWRQNAASALYVLGLLSEEGGRKYFLEVLKMRGILYLLAVCSGITVFGVAVAVLGVLITGLMISMLMTTCVIQFGLNGGLIAAGLLFPQYLVYIPCVFWGAEKIFNCSADLCRRRTSMTGKLPGYILSMLLCGIFCLGGMFLEAYCNPGITEILIKNIKIY